MEFTCKPCDSKFSTKANFDRHVETDKHKKCCAPPPEQQQSQFEQLLAAIQSLKQTVSEMKDEIVCLKEIVHGKMQAPQVVKAHDATQAVALASLSEANKSLVFDASQMHLKHTHEVEIAAIKSQHSIELLRSKMVMLSEAPLKSIKKTITAKQEESADDEDEEPKEVKKIKKTTSAKLLEDSIKKISDFSDKKFFYKKGGYYDKTKSEACSTGKFTKNTFDYVGDHFDEIQTMEAKDKTQLEQHIIRLMKRQIEHFHHMIDPFDMKAVGDLANLLAECDGDCGLYIFTEALKMHREKLTEIAGNFATEPDRSK